MEESEESEGICSHGIFLELGGWIGLGIVGVWKTCWLHYFSWKKLFLLVGVGVELFFFLHVKAMFFT